MIRTVYVSTWAAHYPDTAAIDIDLDKLSDERRERLANCKKNWFVNHQFQWNQEGDNYYWIHTSFPRELAWDIDHFFDVVLPNWEFYQSKGETE